MTNSRLPGGKVTKVYNGRGVVENRIKEANIITSGRCQDVEAMTGLADNPTELTQSFIAELRR